MKGLNCCRAQRFQRSTCVITTWRWLAEGQKTAKKQPIASSYIPRAFTRPKEQSSEYENATRVCILNPECSEVEIERQLPVGEYANVFAYQNKLVCIGGWENENKPGSRRVDLMDLSTGHVSSLPDMIKARCSPVGVGTENEIFVFGTRIFSDSPDCFSNEVYEAALGRRVIF
ncbi:unnamed protein product [Hymenolepis diminuta]|uniref:Peptidase S1 domain-containing protein n=1 Tax=Hymenolepis diminuta TaxID=6216 RepID=A0A0R3SKC2_HYMDI|nr:unnamed protein product [Hymenolepis diminuta]